MHVDGAEEVLHDEVENVCSNDGKLLKTPTAQCKWRPCRLTLCSLQMIPTVRPLPQRLSFYSLGEVPGFCSGHLV